MLVGEAPGAEEERTGRPFQGAAGKVLDKALAEAGLRREDVFISNVVGCRPPQNRTPTQSEVDTCLHYLLEEIEEVSPKVVVALGNSALTALTGLKGITTQRGKVLEARRELHIAPTVTATLHPASTLYERVGDGYGHIVEDLVRAKGLLTQEESADVTHIHPPGSSDEEILASLKLIASCEALAVDAEWTAGQDSMIWPWSNRGELYSLSLSGRTNLGIVSVALAYPLSRLVRAVLARALQNRSIVCHNAMADTLWLEADGFVVNLKADTMLLAYLLDETQRHNLEAVAVKYGGVEGGWKGHLFYARPIGDEQWREILEYNGQDTRATLLAYEGLLDAVAHQPDDRAEAILRLHDKLLLPAVRVLRKASLEGTPMDRQQLEVETQSSLARQLEAADDLAEIVSLTPKAALSLATSPKKTKDYLNALGLDAADSRKDRLKELLSYPAIPKILAIRQEQKLLSTYLQPWATMLDRQGDGRIHSVYRPAGTRTGRLSAESEIGGSLQVTPRAKWVRELLRAPDGHLIGGGDFATVELRVIAWLANEPTMLRFFQEGLDLHRATAGYFLAVRERGAGMSIGDYMRELDLWVERVTGEQRQAAKGGNFGLAYGMGAEKLRDYARLNYGAVISVEEAYTMHRGFFQLYAALPAYHRQAVHNAQRYGYTETPFGRRRKFEEADAHAAINTPVQSTASDFTLLAMIATAAAFEAEHLDAVVIGQVHDSILIDTTEAHADRAAALLKHEMENIDTSSWGFTIPVPLPADIKLGKTWAG